MSAVRDLDGRSVAGPMPPAIRALCVVLGGCTDERSRVKSGARATQCEASQSRTVASHRGFTPAVLMVHVDVTRSMYVPGTL